MAQASIHCTFCGQTYLGTRGLTCSLCGKSGGITDPEDPLSLRELTIKRNEADTIQHLRRGIALFAALLLSAIGVGCLLLLALDNTEDNEDVALFVGVPCLLVGGFIFLMVSVFRARRFD